MTGWKTTLLATQWLLMSTAHSAQWDWTLYPDPKPYQLPRAFQERVLPPKEFDHEYDGELTIHHLLEQDLYEKCRGAVRGSGMSGRALACTAAIQTPRKKCTIWMMTEPTLARLGWDYNIIMRHEIGHCNGWHHESPNGVRCWANSCN
jgi:hypothetical protein